MQGAICSHLTKQTPVLVAERLLSGADASCPGYTGEQSLKPGSLSGKQPPPEETLTGHQHPAGSTAPGNSSRRKVGGTGEAPGLPELMTAQQAEQPSLPSPGQAVAWPHVPDKFSAVQHQGPSLKRTSLAMRALLQPGERRRE